MRTKETYFKTFEAAATTLEEIRDLLGHGATLKYAGIPVPPAYWEYAGALEQAMALYDHEHPEHPCGAVPVHEGQGVFVHETCTGNTSYKLYPAEPYGRGWFLLVERSQDSPPVGGGWNKEIAEIMGVDWESGPWDRDQELWDRKKGAAHGDGPEIQHVERPK